MVRYRRFAKAMQMADVECQTEQRMSDALVQFGEARHRVDEHARLRLKSESDGTPFRVRAEFPATLDKTSHQPMRVAGFRACPRPEAHRVGTEVRGNVDGVTEGCEPSCRFHRVAQECRLVFAARVEEEARPGLDDGTQAVLLEQCLDADDLLAEPRVERAERVMIERDGDSTVT